MSKATTIITKTKGDLCDDKFCRQYWDEKGQHLLKGATIIGVRYMTKKECEPMMWEDYPIALLLEKGGNEFWVYPSRDDEGNNGGALFMTNDEYCMPTLRERG